MSNDPKFLKDPEVNLPRNIFVVIFNAYSFVTQFRFFSTFEDKHYMESRLGYYSNFPMY